MEESHGDAGDPTLTPKATSLNRRSPLIRLSVLIEASIRIDVATQSLSLTFSKVPSVVLSPHRNGWVADR